MRILHILSQRPGLSGSGVFFNSMVREAARRGLKQFAVVAGPADTTHENIGPIQPEQFRLIPFPSPQAPFPVPGNSDVMPYPSTVFSSMTRKQIDQYCQASRSVLEAVAQEFQPTLVHSHHLWLMTALARETFPNTPLVATAHNTELRQLIKAPHLTDRVRPGIQKLDRIGALTPQSRLDTIRAFGVHPSRVVVTGAGYRADLFHPASESRSGLLAQLRDQFGLDLTHLGQARIISFAGRLSSPKGVGFLLRAVAQIRNEYPDLRLVLMGGTGFGKDGERLQAEVRSMGDSVLHLGAIEQAAVALIFQASDLFVSASLFEGLPLVMLEAAACGCPCLVSGLPTIRSWVPEDWLSSGDFQLVPPLKTRDADRPLPEDIERFVADIARGITRQLNRKRGSIERLRQAKRLFGHAWSDVFERYWSAYQTLNSG